MEITININCEALMELAKSLNNFCQLEKVKAQNFETYKEADNKSETKSKLSKSKGNKGISNIDKNVETAKYSVEDIRKAFTEFAKKNGKEAAKEILLRYNSDRVTELPESVYSEVMDILKED